MPYKDLDKKRANQAKWRRNNLDKIKGYRRANRGRIRGTCRTYKAKYYSQWKELLDKWGYSSCVQCGTSKGRINLHHLDPQEKELTPSHWYAAHAPTCSNVETFKLELSKCVPLCYQCHMAAHTALNFPSLEPFRPENLVKLKPLT